MKDPRYPIGNFEFKPFSQDTKSEWLAEMKAAPSNLDEAIQNLNKEQLDTPYRDGGWTVRQLIHHLADSHMNAFIVFKLALTEEKCHRVINYNESFVAAKFSITYRSLPTISKSKSRLDF